MLQTYEGVLRGDRIEWAGDAPPAPSQGAELRVHVTLLEPPTSEAEELERRKRAVAALRALAALTEEERLGLPADPVEWQREIRRDRPLPGRED